MTKPKIAIGWILASKLTDSTLAERYSEAAERLLEHLQIAFPSFDWQLEPVERRAFPAAGLLKPLPLLELGAEEKLYHQWDFSIVVVPNDLEPRQRISTLGVPSSALEVAVVSSARLGPHDALPERLAALALHLLGHLFTLEYADEGPMRPPGKVERLTLESFPKAQYEIAQDALQDVADARLEETSARWNVVTFYFRAFFSDPSSILRSIWGYAPWKMPLYLGRLTATVIVSLLFLLLTAESWEAGTNSQLAWLLTGSGAAITASSLFIFYGQNLEQLGHGPGRGWSEQLARSRIVLFGTLFVGMISLWFVLFSLLLVVSYALPLGVVAGWSGFEPAELPRINYVVFMASIGILAAALGGNLEEEGEIKAALFFDEEV